MAKSVYIYGPAGCGKSTNAEKLKKHFGLDRVLDDYYDDTQRSSQGTARTTGDLIIGQSLQHAPKGVLAMAYSDAAKAAGIPLKAQR